MKTEYSNCWEFRDGRLFSVNDPIDGDGDVDSAIFSSGYRQEVSSKVGNGTASAEVSLYKNHEPKNGKPLFYLEFMGTFEGIGALIANDFAHLASTLNHLNGMLVLFKLDQSSATSDLTITALAQKPQLHD